MLSTIPVVVCLGSGDSLRGRLQRLSEVRPAVFTLAEASESEATLLALCDVSTPLLVLAPNEQLLGTAIKTLRGFVELKGSQVLLYSEVTDCTQLLRLMREGCSGVVAPSTPDATLLKAIRCVLAGELWFPRSVLSKLAKEWRAKEPLYNLTPRESHILTLIVDGRTNQQIADLCFISRETVRWHIRSLYSKIGVADRKAAILQTRRISTML